jgi:hypothetical protein
VEKGNFSHEICKTNKQTFQIHSF